MRRALLLALPVALGFASGCASAKPDPADVTLQDSLIDKMATMAETPGHRDASDITSLERDRRVMHALNSNIANPGTRTAVYAIAAVRT